MQIGSKLDIDEALRTEFRIVSRIASGHDFYEGVRAVIIDKDNRPRWKPAAIESVESAAIESISRRFLKANSILACKLVPVPHEDARIKQNGGASRYGAAIRLGEPANIAGEENRAGLFLVVFMRLLPDFGLSKGLCNGARSCCPRNLCSTR